METEQIIHLGYNGDYNARSASIDISELRALCPDGVPVLMAQRRGEKGFYLPAGTEVDGSTLVWTFDANDTQVWGRGKVQIKMVDAAGNILAHSPVFGTFVHSSIDGAADAPPWWDTWEQRIVAMVATVQQDADAAKDAAGNAYNYADAAEKSAQAAAASAAGVETSANMATDAAEQASAAVEAAAAAVQAASDAAGSALGAAGAAEDAASQASEKAGDAATSASNAMAAAGEAAASKDAAAQYSQTAIDAANALVEQIGAIKKDIAQKLTEPDNAQIGQYFRVASIDADGHYVLEAVDAPTVGVTDVQVNDVSMVTGGVVSFKANSASGITVNNGIFQISQATTSTIDGREASGDANKQPIVRSNLDYAVKAAMCDGKGAAWTAEEQAAGRERLGIDSADNWERLIDITLEEEATISAPNAWEPVYNKFIFKVIRTQKDTHAAYDTQVQFKGANNSAMVVSHQNFGAAVNTLGTRGYIEMYKFSDNGYRCTGYYTTSVASTMAGLDPQGSMNTPYGYQLSGLPTGIAVTGTHGVGSRLIVWGCK